MRTKRWLTILTLLISLCFVLLCLKSYAESPVTLGAESWHSAAGRTAQGAFIWKNETVNNESTKAAPWPDARCPDTSPHLSGPHPVDLNQTLSLDAVRGENRHALQAGGRFKPRDCVAAQKVAVIVPFRNRHHQLKYLLHYLHPLLQRQQVEYDFYVINQHGDGTFNKARLMNAGFIEARKEREYDCFIFHDVDIIPMDDRNPYRCYGQPRHLAVAVDKFNFRLGYNQLIGGAIALSKAQFLKVNGFSNSFWGWGGEDDAMYLRITFKGMGISRPNSQVARYTMFKHARDLHNEPNPNNGKVLTRIRQTMNADGINSLVYRVVETEKDMLYTFITVDIGTP